MLGPVPRHDHELVERVNPLGADQVTGERLETGDVAARTVRDPVGPGRLGRDRRGAGHQLEVHGAVGVGVDDPAVGPVVGRVFHADLARLDQDRGGGRIGGRNDPAFAGFLVADPDDDVAVVGGDAQAQEHAVVGFLVDQHVVPAARRPAEDLGGPGVLVAPDPEQPPAVGREDQAAVGALDRRSQDLAGRQVADADREIFRALLIDGPGVEGVVGTVLGRADLEEGLALAERLLVEQHLFAPLHARLRAPWAARVDRMLSADLVTDVVVPGAVGLRDRAVVLFDPPLHLGEHLGLQGFRSGQHGLGVGVLRLKVLADVGPQRLGVAQDLLPVVVLHPAVVVDADAAQLLDAPGALGGDGRLGNAHGR